MKSFYVRRGTQPCFILELSFLDMLKLLCGRELKDKEGFLDIVIRQQLPYSAFNMAAGRVHD